MALLVLDIVHHKQERSNKTLEFVAFFRFWKYLKFTLSWPENQKPHFFEPQFY